MTIHTYILSVNTLFDSLQLRRALHDNDIIIAMVVQTTTREIVSLPTPSYSSYRVSYEASVVLSRVDLWLTNFVVYCNVHFFFLQS